MGKIHILDCTLRDGGCVNDFNFGSDYMHQIMVGLQKSKVDYVECGYLDDTQGSSTGRTKFIDEESVEKELLSEKKDGQKYLAMMDFGKFDVTKMPERNDKSIDGVRLAFHKEAVEHIVDIGKKILSKGYSLFVQPMLTIRYSDDELIRLINMVNDELSEASAFYIVDSFGEMRGEDVKRCVYLVNHNLNPDIAMGFHSHNNLQLSYANAVEIINMQLRRDIFIDASVLGMGKGAGNLNTELLLEYMNFNRGTSYDIAPLLDVIDNVLNQLKEETPWGYSIEYYLSSVNHCTPTYAGHLFAKHTLSISQISEILSMIEPHKKISFDQDYIEKLYTEFNERSERHELDTEELKREIGERKVLLVAPGQSVIKYKDRIQNFTEDKKIFSIAVNADFDFKTDLTIVTKNMPEIGDISAKHSTIVTSNVEGGKNCRVISYERWSNKEGEARDSAVVIILNFLYEIGIKDIYMAGFDGFKPQINSNYFNKANRRPMGEQRASERNAYIGSYLSDMRKKVRMEFITPTMYFPDEIVKEMLENE